MCNYCTPPEPIEKLVHRKKRGATYIASQGGGFWIVGAYWGFMQRVVVKDPSLEKAHEKLREQLNLMEDDKDAD